ncbi:hypothetical protein N431DRAFT_448260 [Stipitochalara longipes BDJ]|nr:hypothetical protein N431DRAFT_448260 [Stipitochalara longipes BDJ]
MVGCSAVNPVNPVNPVNQNWGGLAIQHPRGRARPGWQAYKPFRCRLGSPAGSLKMGVCRVPWRVRPVWLLYCIAGGKSPTAIRGAHTPQSRPLVVVVCVGRTPLLFDQVALLALAFLWHWHWHWKTEVLFCSGVPRPGDTCEGCHLETGRTKTASRIRGHRPWTMDHGLWRQLSGLRGVEPQGLR